MLLSLLLTSWWFDIDFVINFFFFVCFWNHSQLHTERFTWSLSSGLLSVFILFCISMWCTVLPQKRHQVTFWVKLVFGIIVRSTLSTLIWYQNQVHTPYFLLRYYHLCIRPCKRFLWKFDFEKPAYSYCFWYNRQQKMCNFLWENVWKSVRNYMEVTENKLRYVVIQFAYHKKVLAHLVLLDDLKNMRPFFMQVSKTFVTSFSCLFQVKPTMVMTSMHARWVLDFVSNQSKSMFLFLLCFTVPACNSLFKCKFCDFKLTKLHENNTLPDFTVSKQSIYKHNNECCNPQLWYSQAQGANSFENFV